MSAFRRLIPVALAIAGFTLCSLGAAASAWAQAGDGWSFVLTPQVWLSHIAKNGFSSAPNISFAGPNIIVGPAPDFAIAQQNFSSTSSPNQDINPQWGIQVAAQKDLLTLAGAFQYANFGTHNDITYTGLPFCAGSACANPGDRWAQERINTTRIDADLSANYFFPDIVKEWLDASAGIGFKFIYAEGSRHYTELSPLAAVIDQRSGLYVACDHSTINAGSHCVDVRRQVKQETYLYAVTFPLNATLHLTRDARWLLPFSITPLIGAEYRNDHNVVYSATSPATAAEFISGTPIKINREDGTKFAYGVTADLIVRWLITDMLSAYAGMRVQYIHGHDEYLAYGPLVGMSVRFGGK